MNFINTYLLNFYNVPDTVYTTVTIMDLAVSTPTPKVKY